MLNKFKQMQKSKLSLALSAVLALGAYSGAAQAVNLTNDGLGDAASFPYYTANKGWQTFFRVVNTSANAVAIKVRFREAANSREALDFIVFLSPHDEWIGWTDPSADKLDGTGSPGIRTNDYSCMLPGVEGSNSADRFSYLEANPFTRDYPVKGAAFKTTAFTGTYDDGATAAGVGVPPNSVTPSNTNRVEEGHIEMFGLAAWDPTFSGNSRFVVNSASHGRFGGDPDGCADLQARFEGGSAALATAADYGDPEDVGNYLAFNAYLINVAEGKGAGYDPTVFANFTNGRAPDQAMVTTVSDAGLMWQALATDIKPDMDSADPVSTVQVNDVAAGAAPQDQLVTLAGIFAPDPNRIHSHSDFGTPISGGVDAVSSTIMRSSVINEWAAKEGTHISKYFTQWVLNFPTKHYYVDFQDDNDALDDIAPTLDDPQDDIGDLNDAVAPFANEFDIAGNSCDPFQVRVVNREEIFEDVTSPSAGEPLSLCWETNVVSFGDATKFGASGLGLESDFATNVPETELPREYSRETGSFKPSEAGWARLTFTGAPSQTTGLTVGARVLAGKPVDGFMFSVFETNRGSSSNHTTINAHKYERDEIPQQPGG